MGRSHALGPLQPARPEHSHIQEEGQDTQTPRKSELVALEGTGMSDIPCTTGRTGQSQGHARVTSGVGRPRLLMLLRPHTQAGACTQQAPAATGRCPAGRRCGPCWPPSPALPPTVLHSQQRGPLCSPTHPRGNPRAPDRHLSSAIPVWDSAQNSVSGARVMGPPPNSQNPQAPHWWMELWDQPALNEGGPPSRGRVWLLEKRFLGCRPLLLGSFLCKLRG